MSRQRWLQKGKSGQADRSGPTISFSHTGQHVLIIAKSLGFRRFFFRLRRLGVGFLLRGIGLTVGGRLVGLGAFLVGFGGGFIGLAAIIRLIESRAFEDDGRSGPKNPAQFWLAALRTFLQGLVIDRLKFVKIVLTGIAMVFVGWHTLRFLDIDGSFRGVFSLIYRFAFTSRFGC